MKTKQFVIALMLVLVQGSVMAQSEFNFTPKVGLNIANVSGIVGATDPRYGLNVGFSVEKMFLPQFALEVGVFYSMQGLSSPVVDFNLDYINVPILAKYYIINGLNVFAGPQLGFNVKAEASMVDYDEGGRLTDRASVSVKENIKTFDPALAIGLGYQFNSGLSFSANYNFGLSKIIKETYYGSDGNNRNNVMQANLGWRF